MINNRISAWQFGVLIFLSSITFVGSLLSELVRGNLYDSVISSLISTIISLAFLIPIIKLKNKNIDVLRSKTLVSKILLVIYILFFLYSIVWELTSISNMLMNTVLPYDSLVLMVLSMVVVAIYGSLKGIETVGRSGLLILIIAVFCIVLMAVGTIPLVSDTGSRVFFYDGYGDTLSNAVRIFTRSTFLPQILIIMPSVNIKNFGKSLVVSQIISGVLISLIFLITQITLSEYAKIQQFPVYTLTSAIVMEPLKRMDVIFTVIWIMIAILRITTSFLAIGKCSLELKDEKFGKIFLYILGVLAVLLTVFLVNREEARYVLSLNIYLVLAVTLGAVLPTGILAVYKGGR